MDQDNQNSPSGQGPRKRRPIGQASQPEKRGTPNSVDKKSTQNDRRQTPSSVDNKSTPNKDRAAEGSAKKEKKPVGAADQTNRGASIDNIKVPSFTPTGFGNAKTQNTRFQKNPKPSGPDAQTIKRIQQSKSNLESKNKKLDQDTNSRLGRESKSFFASKGMKRISDNTTQQYSDRGRLLINRYKRENLIPLDYDDFEPTDFVQWLLSLKPTVKSSTWRVYRQAAYHMLEGMPADIDHALTLLDNDIIENDSRAGKKENWDGKITRGSHKTSSMKEKRFPKKDLDKVLAFLRYKSRSKLAPILTDWLIATLNTGLRPIEWRATAIERTTDQNGKTWIWLYVVNAKATNLRANGKVRTLDISDLPTDVIACIERMSNNGLSWLEDGNYDSIKSQVGQLLYSVGEKLFPKKSKSYALYSCRHQFIANMKLIMSPEEVSALSGHAVTKTAMQSYGKKRSSWSPEEITTHPKPIADEVSTVRKTAEFYTDRMKKLAEMGLLKGNSDLDYPV